MNAQRVCPECGDEAPIVLDEALQHFQCLLCAATWQAGDTPEDGAFEELMRQAGEEQP